VAGTPPCMEAVTLGVPEASNSAARPEASSPNVDTQATCPTSSDHLLQHRVNHNLSQAYLLKANEFSTTNACYVDSVLVNMCKYMGISSYGTDAYLRFILRKRL
jgi:hypothetical protein